jgi:hypothetical protein
MCFQVYSKPSHRCIEKGIGVFGKDKGFHSVTHPSPTPQVTLHSWGRKSMGIKEKDSIFGIILTHLFMTKGEDSTSRALMIPFLAIHAKGGESMSPKQKDRTTTNLKNFVFPRILSIGILLCSKGGESSISKMLYQNPLEQ